MRFWTVNHKWEYWADFILFPLQSIILLGIAGSRLTVWAGLMLAAGIVFWSFVEYCLHRWVFHGPWSTIRRQHLAHHQFPDEYIGVSPWPTLLVTQFWFWVCIFLKFEFFLAGFLWGYTWYITAHALAHSSFAPKWIKQAHELHHAREYKQNYGVSHRGWDWVFRTKV